MILEEIAKMRLEKQGYLGNERKNTKLVPTLPTARTPPEAPRLDPVSLPSEKTDPTRAGNGRTNPKAPSRSDAPASETSDKGTEYPSGVIVISDSSSDENVKPSRQMDRTTKQATMRLLVKRARSATDNTSIADLLQKFLETYALTNTRSRFITRDAFEFLDVLVRQLEDPSVIASRKAESEFSCATSNDTRLESTEGRLRQRPPTHMQKSETLKTLRQRIQNAPQTMSNQELAKVLSDFCAAVRLTTGKTLTKDGVAILEGIESRLR